LNIITLLRAATVRLRPISDSPELDAEILLSHAINQSRSYLYTWPEKVLTPAQRDAFDALLQRRLQSEPIAYIMGRREFWSLDLRVSQATLIPRPETELLVELALQKMPLQQSVTVADLGTGCGAIALAIASERPQARITATDSSHAALELARYNAGRLQIGSVAFRHGDWCRALGDDRFDVIVCNPPYVAADSCYMQQGDVRFEPPQALIADENGMRDLKTVIRQARSHLKTSGWLLLEHGFDQAQPVVDCLRLNGYCDIATCRDLAGHARVSLGRIT
jgi:release factor glutamine methyltransferase